MDSAFALLVAVVLLSVAFDYVNGFHDTANAIATVVSTNVLSPRTAVFLAWILTLPIAALLAALLYLALRLLLGA